MNSGSRFDSWVGKSQDPLEKDSLPTPVFLGFPHGSDGKESACYVGDLGSIPGLGISPGQGNSYPLQYSGLENRMNCIVHGVTKSWTELSDFHTTKYVSMPFSKNKKILSLGLQGEGLLDQRLNA